MPGPVRSDYIPTQNATKTGKSLVGDLGEILNYDFNNSEGRIDGGMFAADVHHYLSHLLNFTEAFGGQFLCDPNEFNGWGILGAHDNTNSQDLGNVGAAANRLSGGFCYPFDVQPVKLYAWHQNNNAEILPWGWRINSQEKIGGANTVTNAEILRECVGTGATATAPRDYGNTNNQNTDIDLSSAPVIPAGNVITLGVEAPTAVATNRYVRVMSGFIEFKRIIPAI